MTRLYVIRHGKPSSTWGQHPDPDPGLDETGKAQAEAAAERLMALPANLRPTRVFSSPLRRCRETAQPFADRIGVAVEIDPLVGEIPTPKALLSARPQRGPWLRDAFQKRWAADQGRPRLRCLAQDGGRGSGRVSGRRGLQPFRRHQRGGVLRDR